MNNNQNKSSNSKSYKKELAALLVKLRKNGNVVFNNNQFITTKDEQIKSNILEIMQTQDALYNELLLKYQKKDKDRQERDKERLHELKLKELDIKHKQLDFQTRQTDLEIIKINKSNSFSST